MAYARADSKMGDLVQREHPKLGWSRGAQKPAISPKRRKIGSRLRYYDGLCSAVSNALKINTRVVVKKTHAHVFFDSFFVTEPTNMNMPSRNTLVNFFSPVQCTVYTITWLHQPWALECTASQTNGVDATDCRVQTDGQTDDNFDKISRSYTM